MATFVLVHGAWAGGWIWKKITPLLRAAGHDVHATTATGLGDRVHLTDPAIDLMPGFLVIDPYAEWIRGLTPDPADHAWLFAKLVPQSLATYTQPIRLGNPAAAALPRAFIFCTEGKGDVAVDPTVRTASRIRSAPGWRYRELADTHLAPVNGPQATAEALLSLV